MKGRTLKLGTTVRVCATRLCAPFVFGTRCAAQDSNETKEALELLEKLQGAAACAVAGVDGSATDVRERNYQRFARRIRAIAEEGATISWCSLAAPRDGSRSALVYVKGRSEPLKFEQPWEGDCI